MKFRYRPLPLRSGYQHPTDDLAMAGMRITHYQCHPPYTDISISDDVVDNIEMIEGFDSSQGLTPMLV